MNESEKPLGEPMTGVPSSQPRRVWGFGIFLAVLVLAFAGPLVSLAKHASGSALHSHIVLIPFVSIYLLVLQRPRLPGEYRSSMVPALALMVAALAALGLAWGPISLSSLSHNDFLALMTLSFLCFLAAGAFLFLGRRWVAAAAFPMGFLLFMIPMPDGMVDWLETGSMLASTEAADLLFNWSGTPVLREGTLFQLPGIVLQVAQECSGIRSSWVLFITSLLASHVFLTSPWRRAALVLFVIPLGVVRNGLRILTIGLLCVHVGRHMIDSPIHHKGGPIFFALSLIPLFLFLWWLRRGETKSRQPSEPRMNADERE